MLKKLEFRLNYRFKIILKFKNELIFIINLAIK
jgi:hypothetical protein